MSSMKAAMQKAGVKSAADLLADAIDRVMAQNPMGFDAAAECLFDIIAYDGIIVKHVFRNHARAILLPLIRNRMAEKSAARGHGNLDDHATNAPRNNPASAGSRLGQDPVATHPLHAQSATVPVKAGGGGQCCYDAQKADAPANNPPRVPAAMVSRIHRDLLLDEVMPNGKRFRDCTKADLEGMSKTLGRKAHRCSAVAAQLTAPWQTVADAGITNEEISRVDAAWNGE